MKEKRKIPVSDGDYVEFYANSLKENNEFFRQHKILIDSQIIASRQIFSSKFGKGKDFEKNARKYLIKLGIIKGRR